MIQRRDAIPENERNARSELACEILFSQMRSALPDGATVALFSPLGSEVNTRPLITLCEQAGWRVCLPCMVKGENGETPELATLEVTAPSTSAPDGSPQETAPNAADANAAQEAAPDGPQSAMPNRPKTHMEFVALPDAYASCTHFDFIAHPARGIKRADVEALNCTFVDATSFDAVVVPLVAFDDAGFRLGYGGGNYDRLLPQLREDAFISGIAFAEQRAEHLPTEAHDLPLPRITIA